MSLELHKIKPQKGATKKRKRVGRGNASGHGTYSTRGQKGQRARSGGRNKLKIKGFKKALLKFPKLRGFKSLAAKNTEIGLSMLDKNFENNAIINPIALKEKGLLESPNEKFKILNNGEVKKSFTIQNCLVSDGAVKKIEKAGGKVEVLAVKEKNEEKKTEVKAGKKNKK